MKTKCCLISICISTLFCFFMNNAYAAPAGWQVTKLTNNDYEDMNPKASEGKVVWVANDGTDSEIMFYNGTSTVQLTNNSYDETSPGISGNNIVWSGFDGQDWEIFYYNGSSTIQLTNNTYNDTNPSISGNQIVWQGAWQGLGSHIFYYNGSSTTQISMSGAEWQCSNPIIDGSKVVWLRGGRNSKGQYERYIMLYDASETKIIAGPVYAYISSLSFKGDFITWSQKAGRTKFQVYRHFIQTGDTSAIGSTQLSNACANTSGRATVWQTTSETSKDIYWRLVSGPYSNLTKSSSAYDNIYPCISDLRIVWIQHHDTYDYVYLRDGGRNIRLSTVSSDSVKPPYIDGTTITWAQRDSDDFEVWMAIPRPIYVDDSAPGSQTGLSWYNAYTKLQDALAVAASGDEIRVAHGIYYPDEGNGQLDNFKESTFQIVSGTALKGAYAGYGALNPNERDPNLYETILSGDLQQNDLPITDITDLFYGRNDNTRYVVTSSGTDPETLIDGFTITGARAGLGYAGGGLKALPNNVLTVSNCTFKLNQAALGGAIYQIYGQLTIENCDFQNNLAITGGAIYAQSCDIQIIDSDFTGNCAQLTYEPGGYSSNGGAVIVDNSNSSIRGCRFVNNYALKCSGAIHYDASGPITTDTYDCSFIGNRSQDWGGGILYLATGTGNIARCSFINNSSGQGAGLAIYNSIYPYITNCEFIANFSTGSGGAIWNGHNCSPKIFGSLFVGNSAGNSGGAILCTNYNNIESGWPRFYNCTFVDNSAPLGSLVACEKDSLSSYGPSSVTVANSIIWQSGNLVYIDDGSTVGIGYSDVQGGYSGNGNFDDDPCFVSLPDDGGDGFGDNPVTPEDESANDNYGNLRLSSGSPCIDRGYNGLVHFDYADLDDDGYKAEPVPYDIDGFNRFTDDPSALDVGSSSRFIDIRAIIDLGCYERGICGDDSHPYPDGDTNYDCVVDINDFAIFAGNWLNCTAPDL